MFFTPLSRRLSVREKSGVHLADQTLRRGSCGVCSADLLLECNQVILAAGQESSLKRLPHLYGRAGLQQILAENKTPVEEAVKVLAGIPKGAGCCRGCRDRSGQYSCSHLWSRLAALRIYHVLQAGKDDSEHHLAPPMNGREESRSRGCFKPLAFQKHRISFTAGRGFHCFSCGICSSAGFAGYFALTLPLGIAPAIMRCSRLLQRLQDLRS